MGEVYKNNRDGGIKKSIGQYSKLIPICGGCFVSGVGYIVGSVGGAAKYAISQIPYIIGADHVSEPFLDRLVDVIGDSARNGYSTGAQLAGVGFLGGLIVTVKFKNTIKDFFGK